MKRYLLKTLQDALQTWITLEVGIIISAILYAILKVEGVPDNTGLLVAFITLVGLIVLGLVLFPTNYSRLGQSLKKWLLGEQRLSKQLDSLIVQQNMLLEKLNQRFTLELARENIKEFALISEQGQERLVGEQRLSKQLDSLIVQQNMLLEKLNQRFTLELARENIKEFALISEQGQERLVRAIMPSFQENARLQKDAFSALIKSQQELLEELVVILKNQQANFEQLTQIQREGQGHHGVTRRRIDEQKEASSTFRERQFTTKTASGIQPKMLKFIEDYNEREDMPPTTREIAQALGISNGQVNYHLMMLEKKGLISQASRNRRSIRLLKSIRGVPVMGYIAAGTPLEISNDPEEMIDVGNDMELENTYVLIVKGRSMIEEGILDGDYVVIKPQSTYNSGDLIVAVHNEPESSGATLKRFFREGDLIRLQPANSELSPLYISAAEWISEWTVQGKVMEIIRMG